MSALAKGKLKKKRDEIKEALVGNFREHHKFMLKTSLEHIKSLEKLIGEIEEQIDKKLASYPEEYKLLQTIPGVKEHGAASIIAEIGVDMNKFPVERIIYPPGQE